MDATQMFLLFFVPVCGFFASEGVIEVLFRHPGQVSPHTFSRYLVVVLFLGQLLVPCVVGIKRPGAIFEKNSYKRMFYVYFYPEYGLISNHRSYRIPAMIEPRPGGFYDVLFGFWNGRKIFFDSSGSEITPGKVCAISSGNGKTDTSWGIELTQTPVSLGDVKKLLASGNVKRSEIGP